jgi:hypothetical protein
VHDGIEPWPDRAVGGLVERGQHDPVAADAKRKRVLDAEPELWRYRELRYFFGWRDIYYVDGNNLVGLDIGQGSGWTVPIPLGTPTTCGGTPLAPTGCTSEPHSFGAGTPTVMSDGTVAVPVVTGTRTVVPGAVADPASEDPFAFQAAISILYLRRHWAICSSVMRCEACKRSKITTAPIANQR